MKGFNILLVFLFGIFTCLAQQNSEISSSQFYGKEFEATSLSNKDEVWQTFSSMPVSDSLNLQLGDAEGNVAYGLLGKVDDLKIYQQALSYEQILTFCKTEL